MLSEISQLHKCGRCGRKLPIEFFYTRKDRPAGVDIWSWCKECHSLYSRDYYKKHKKQAAFNVKRLKLALKYEAMNYYGRVCACCDESNFWFLEVDPIDNDGAAHRKEMGNGNWGGVNILRWLKANNWPEGFQFLCSNCNQAKSRYKVCPHQRRNMSPNRLTDIFPSNFQSNNAGGGS